MSTSGRILVVAGSLLALTLLWPDLAWAQTSGSDPFTQAVNWFVGGPALVLLGQPPVGHG